MPRKKTDKTRQAEALDAEVNVSGAGEDPAVKALLSDEFVTGTNADAAEIAMSLVQIIRKMDFLTDDVARIKERMEKMDLDLDERDRKEKKYIEEVLSRAERLKATGEEKDKIQVKGAIAYTEALKAARAEAATRNLMFEEQLRNMPKTTVVSPGELYVVIEGGQQVSKLLPQIVRIKHKQWVLMPGVPTEVPKIVADRLDAINRSREETERRKALLRANLSSETLAQKWNEISGSEPMTS